MTDRTSRTIGACIVAAVVAAVYVVVLVGGG